MDAQTVNNLGGACSILGQHLSYGHGFSVASKHAVSVAACSYPAGMPGAPSYAEAFSPLPGRCFRLVTRDGEGGPMHCSEPPTWRGTYRARDGRRYTVEACEGHRPQHQQQEPA